MLWAQSALSFVVWCAVGVWSAKRILARGLSPRPVTGPVAMIGGAVVLVAGLYAVGLGRGIENGELSPWAWAAVTVIGAAFVHMQAWGAIGLASMALKRETGRPAEPSVAKEDSV